MLSIAKQRAISLGLEQVIEFKEGDVETIDLSASTFDAALCRFGLMFLPNLRGGLSNIYRSLVDGGRLAAAVWASPDKVPFIALALNTVMKETKSPPPPAGNQPQERREEILKAVTESARKYAANDTGSVRLSNEAICVVGTK
jgi:ubiquinone/menaquinone biosynthesis C-methylase UbiE